MPVTSPVKSVTTHLLGLFPEAILDHIDAPVQVVDRQYRFVWSNTFEVDGRIYTPERFLDQICYEHIFDRTSPCPDCPLHLAMTKGEAGVQEKIFPKRDGSYSWREVRSYPIFGENGRVEYVVKIGFDITHKKRSQSQQERYLNSLESSLQNTSESEQRRIKAQAEASDRFGLTSRELEVLRLVAEGFTNVNIAKLLTISPNTVKTHIVHVFDKLGVSDRAQAAVWAARMKLV